MNTVSNHFEEIHSEKQVHDFDLKDSKGRDITRIVFVRSYLVVSAESNWNNNEADKHEVGATVYSALVWAGRGADTFGAVQRRYYFTTREALDAHVTKKLAEALKREQAKAAKAGRN